MEDVEGLASVCAGLGCPSQDPGAHYIKGDHCLENLKNLQRFLRRDHPSSRPVFKQLGKWNTVRQDLVPMLLQYRDDSNLIINAVKVMVFLTMPVDATSEGVSQQLEYVLNFKASFLHNDAIAVVMTLLEEPLEHLESDMFSEDDWKVVQLILTLVRNLLDFQDILTQKMAIVEKTSFISLRDELLQHLFQESIMDLLLALAQHVAGPFGLLRQDNMLFLEIFHHIFWGQVPERVARASSDCLKKPSKRPSGLLQRMMEEEKEQLKQIRLRDLPRHSRFSGSFVQVAEDGSKRLLKRNPFQSPIEAVLRGPRFKHGPVKRVACDRTMASTTEEKLLELLKGFADQILTGSYNVIMQSIKDDICRERHGMQATDVTLFFQVATFFTSYQYHKVSVLRGKGGSEDADTPPVSEVHLCGPIASTMAEDTFVMVVGRWHEFLETAKESNDWLPVTVTGTLFKEMVRVLDLVLRGNKDMPGDHQQIRIARILLYKVFYDQSEKGVLQLLLHLVKSFDIHKQPRSHLADLIETIHVVLRIMEFLTREDGALRVLKKGRKSSKKKAKAEVAQPEQAQASGCSGVATVDSPRDLTPSIGSGNNEALGHTEGGTALNKNKDLSRMEGGTALNGNKDLSCTEDGIALNGAEDNEAVQSHKDGTSILSGATNTEESNGGGLLDVEQRESLDTTMNLPRESIGTQIDLQREPLDTPTKSLGSPLLGNIENEVEDEEEGEEQGPNSKVEVSLDIQKCAATFADNTVIRNYCWLLKYFETNSASTNHYILCMLQRVCKDQVREPMLFQLSLMRIFYEILSNKKGAKLEEHQRLYSFLTKLIRNFFKKLKSQPLLFLDVLFWKTRQDCHMISLDYQVKSLQKMVHVSKKSSLTRSIADSLGNDESDVFCPSSGQIEDKLEENRGVLLPPEKSSSSKRQRRKKTNVFTSEQELQLKELFEQYKEKSKCCVLLAQAMDPEGRITSRQIRQKLKEWDMMPVSLKRSKMARDSEGAKDASTMPTKCRKPRKKKKEQEVDSTTNESDEETLTQIAEKLKASSYHSFSGKGSLEQSQSSFKGDHSQNEEEGGETILKDVLMTTRTKQRHMNNPSPAERGITSREAMDPKEYLASLPSSSSSSIISSSSSSEGEDEFNDALEGSSHLGGNKRKLRNLSQGMGGVGDAGANDLEDDDVQNALEDELGIGEEQLDDGGANLSPELGKRRRTMFVLEDDEDM